MAWAFPSLGLDFFKSSFWRTTCLLGIYLFCYKRTSVVNHWDLKAKFHLKQASFELKQKLPSSNSSCRARSVFPLMLVSFPHREPPQNSHKIQGVLWNTVQAHPDRQTDIHSSSPLNTTRLPESSPIFFWFSPGNFLLIGWSNTPDHPFPDNYGFFQLHCQSSCSTKVCFCSFIGCLESICFNPPQRVCEQQTCPRGRWQHLTCM